MNFTDQPIDQYLFEDSHVDGGGGLISVTKWSERTYAVRLWYGHLPGMKPSRGKRWLMARSRS